MNSKELENEVKNPSEVSEETVENDALEKEASEHETAENENTNEESEEMKTAKKEKKEKKDKKDEKIEELSDRVLRQMAEFENYRKRTEKEKILMFDMGAKNIIEKILPVIDNFERGFSMLSEEEKITPFASGMAKVYQQMSSNLEEAGLKEIEALNCEFNPDFHNAVMHEENENFGENTVSEVFQKGYMYKDTLVRCSMVKVAN